jgi:hypothetical protein
VDTSPSVQVVRDAGALLGDGQLAVARVEPGVGQRDRGVRGENPDQLLVGVGEAARLVRQVERPEDLAAAHDRHAQERLQHRMRGRPPAEPRVGPDVGEPLRMAVAQHHREEAVLAWQWTDRRAHLVADPGHHELRERPVVVGHAKRRILRADQLAGRVDDGLQHLGHGDLVADRQHRRGEAADRTQILALRPGHTPTIVRPGRRHVGPRS